MSVEKKQQELSVGQKLAIIQAGLKAPKSKYNKFGNYYYRSAEDILEALKPFVQDLGVHVTTCEDLVTADDRVIIKSTATITDVVSGHSISATALVGVDFAQKGMQVAQMFGSSSSYGKKYSLNNLFLIDDTADADATNTHGKEGLVAANSNKPSIDDVNSDKFKKALAYVKAGKGTIEEIQKTYVLSPEVLKQLRLQSK